jgi:hypothetical protein
MWKSGRSRYFTSMITGRIAPSFRHDSCEPSVFLYDQPFATANLRKSSGEQGN